jgi:acetylornithine deacetylase/succinyl-diaminopimelate desuccinylase-like protein
MRSRHASRSSLNSSLSSNRLTEEHPPLPPWYAHPINFVVSKIEGGDWTSSVPSWCTFDGGIGLYPGQDLAGVRREVEATVAAAAQSDAFLAKNPPQGRVSRLPGGKLRAAAGQRCAGPAERCR